jgi:hypothetical protein
MFEGWRVDALEERGRPLLVIGEGDIEGDEGVGRGHVREAVHSKALRKYAGEREAVQWRCEGMGPRGGRHEGKRHMARHTQVRP